MLVLAGGLLSVFLVLAGSVLSAFMAAFIIIVIFVVLLVVVGGFLFLLTLVPRLAFVDLFVAACRGPLHDLPGAAWC